MPLRGFPDANIVAVFTEPNTTGDIEDINAPRNAPAKTPQLFLSLVQWHIDFFQYELAAPVQTVSINHAALAGRSAYWGPADQFWIMNSTYTSQISYQVPGQTAVREHLLYTHSLGYVPLAFVVWSGRTLMPGVAVQVTTEGRTRFVSVYVTTTGVYLREVCTSTTDALPTITQTYQVMVFRVPTANVTLPFFGWESPEDDDIVIGRGKVNTERQYLRRAATGESPFAIDFGPTVDINAGRARIASGGVTVTEPGYGGSLAPPPFTSVGV
jgi:hypothetical protein